MARDPRSTKQWRAVRLHVLATNPPYCHVCHRWIDYSLPGTHRDGPHVDHVNPLATGDPFDVHNLRPAHNHCNASKRDSLLPQVNSRAW